ncbi:MAG: hypothetical protein NT018_00120 [Armatimonadetes bacterium]|nr:hypothetical protein [Armatimonadota bacterium]
MEEICRRCDWTGRAVESDDTHTYPRYLSAWIDTLPEELHGLAQEFVQGQRNSRLISQLRRELMSREPTLATLDSLSDAKFGCEPDHLAQGALGLWLRRDSSQLSFAFQKITSDEQLSACFWLLMDYFWPELLGVEQAAIHYYGIASDANFAHIRQALRYAAFCSLVELDPALKSRYSPRCAHNSKYPAAFLEHTAQNFLNILGMLGMVDRRDDGSADIGPDLSGIKDDLAFATAVHSEWERLLGFEHGAYGFYVEPNVAWNDALRYQLLAYDKEKVVSKADGYREEICWEICSYMLHQALASMQVIISYDLGRAAQIYEDEVVALFKPLISSKATRVAKIRLQLENGHKTTNCPSEYDAFVMTAQLEAVAKFREIYQAFNFFYFSDKNSLIDAGLGSYRISGEDKREISPIYAAQDSKREFSFPGFAEKLMTLWSNKKARETGISDRSVPLDEDIIHSSSRQISHPTTTADPNNTQWITVDHLAKLLNSPMHRLRKLDMELGCLRAGEVFKDDMKAMKIARLRAKTRLYLYDTDLVHLASIKLGALAARRKGAKTEGSTRAEVSKNYLVPESTLVYWEKRGIVTPIKDGHNVIYTFDQQNIIAKRSNKENYLK